MALRDKNSHAREWPPPPLKTLWYRVNGCKVRDDEVKVVRGRKPLPAGGRPRPWRAWGGVTAGTTSTLTPERSDGRFVVQLRKVRTLLP